MQDSNSQEPLKKLFMLTPFVCLFTKHESCLFASYQRSRVQNLSGSGCQHDTEEQEEEIAEVSKNLSVLLGEKGSTRGLKK